MRDAANVIRSTLLLETVWKVLGGRDGDLRSELWTTGAGDASAVGEGSIAIQFVHEFFS